MSTTALSLLSPPAFRAFIDLTDAAKVTVQHRLAVVEPALTVRRGHCQILRVQAERHGLSFPTVHRWFKAARSGRLDLIVDKRRDSHLWQRKRGEGSIVLPQADIVLWQSYCLKFNGRTDANKAAYRQLIRDWRAAKVTTTQPRDGLRDHPAGWSYANLQRHQPTDYERAAVRQGAFAASAHRPKVLTTRVGLRVGQYYVGDDALHDHLVNWQGHGRGGPVRVVEASVLDLYSAAQVHWGLRPRAPRADGTTENLTEREVRWIVAATLRDRGYRTDKLGTTWLIEHGTFTIREPLARVLQDQFGIRVEMSGIQHAKGWVGAWGGKGGGNPRFKAALESHHRLKHTELASVPMQVGLNSRTAKPEELAAALKYSGWVETLAEQLAIVAPHLVPYVLRPDMPLARFEELLDRTYAMINARRDHELEGWAQCGHVSTGYLIGEQLAPVEALVPYAAAAGLTVAEYGRRLGDSGLARNLVLSPADVWAQGRRELSPLPSHGVAAILGNDLAIERKVTAGEFVFEDAELGLGEHRFWGLVTSPEGARTYLPNGETFQVQGNPWAPDELCVWDAKGRFLGIAARHHRENRADAEAMQRQFKAVADYDAELRAGLNRKTKPMSQERLDLREHNARLRDLALNGPAERAADRAAATVDVGDALRRKLAAATPVDPDDTF